MIKTNKGISLISLIITIAMMVIIASTTIKLSFDRFEINNLNKMINDLELLEDKVSNYYLRYNVIPVVRDNDNTIIKYDGTTLNFDKNAGDNGNYYIIDLKAMEGISLNYGEDGFNNPNSSDDVYIINEKSHSIYYVRGIELDNEYYHSILENTSLNDNIPPTKPSIKVVSGVQDEEGAYTTPVVLEFVPGKDNWSGIDRTTYSINNSEEEDISKLDNNIYPITEEGIYEITLKCYDNNGKVAEYIEKVTAKEKLPMRKVAVNEEANENSTINGKMYSSTNPIIPAGFTPINITIEGQESSWEAEGGPEVDKGLVIVDNEGNEFVWVPVVDDISTTGYTVKENFYVYREPDVITGSNGNSYDAVLANLQRAECTENPEDEDTVLNADDFKVQLTKEYKLMAESVNKYDGFYVGRYETSRNGANPQSKKSSLGQEIISAYNSSEENNWYGLYALNKRYKTSSVQGSMIWGIQYDKMVSWIGSAANMAIADKANTDRTCGTAPDDVIKNIYDLYGNSFEWTLEVSDTRCRVNRSGDFTGNYAIKSRSISNPTVVSSLNGSRIAFYVEM